MVVTLEVPVNLDDLGCAESLELYSNLIKKPVLAGKTWCDFRLSERALPC